VTAACTLVTGAGGFIGRALALSLSAGGENVVATVRPGSRAAASLPRQIEVIPCDLTDARALRALVSRTRPTRCVHAAAIGARRRCLDLDLLLDSNVRATAVLADALADVGAERLVTIGSSSEYGTPAGPMSESLAAEPLDLYGVSKLAGGAVAGAIGRARGLAVLHLRLFSVYGPGEAPERLVSALVHALAARRPIDLSEGRQVRDFIFVDDVVGAVRRALAAPARACDTLNVGTGVETSVRELALLACRIADADEALLRFGVLPERGDERVSYRADTRKASTVLGWSATTTLAAGLRTTFEIVRRESRLAA
jgi:UDP-glucose 4-epimerase